jgi:hypothetical protein
MHDGYNTVDGEEVFFISHPALGLWAASGSFVGFAGATTPHAVPVSRGAGRDRTH